MVYISSGGLQDTQSDLKACLKLLSSLCGRQVIDTGRRGTLCSSDMKTLERNKDKTNFPLVYRDGSSRSVRAESLCKHQQMASSKGGNEPLMQTCVLTWITGSNYFVSADYLSIWSHNPKIMVFLPNTDKYMWTLRMTHSFLAFSPVCARSLFCKFNKAECCFLLICWQEVGPQLLLITQSVVSEEQRNGAAETVAAFSLRKLRRILLSIKD